MHAITEVICGPMFSGKSEELIRRMRRADISGKHAVVFKPSIDTRYEINYVVSHNGSKIDSISIDCDKNGVTSILDKVNEISQKMHIDIVGIDEVHFFDPSIVGVVNKLSSDGIHVIVAGLDKDFRGEPFGPMPQLLAIADYITKLDAVCVKCGGSATRTQRIINGLPAKYNDPVRLVGAKDFYEARCKNCHEVPGKPE
ncbi:MAG: thymidine kinase [Candidatus Aenigmatarchaeota archaeon]